MTAPVSPREELPGGRGRGRSPASADPVEAAEEVSLRPRRLAEFVGQAQLKEHLEIVLEAARRRGQPADHLLFAGPPGLGKTTLAGIVAAEMGVGLRITSGPALVRAGDLAAILTDLAEGDVLFIDEIHRLGRAVEEILYPAMEDFQLDIVLGQGPGGPVDPPRPAPLHPGRGHHPDRPHHRPAARPVRLRGPARLLRARPTWRRSSGRSARILGVRARRRRGRRDRRAGPGARPASPTGCSSGCGTSPRSAATGIVDRDVGRRRPGPVRGRRARPRQGRPGHPATPSATGFGGGPVGLSTLAVSVGEETDTVEDVYEPFLLQLGLLMRTAAGPGGHAGGLAPPRPRAAAAAGPSPALFD